MDETCIKIEGQWKYLYRAVDEAGQTVDFLLAAHRDRKAALRFLKKAIGQHSRPMKPTIDQSRANTAALIALDTDANAHSKIEIRQRKYLNNLIEQGSPGDQTAHSADARLSNLCLCSVHPSGY